MSERAAKILSSLKPSDIEVDAEGRVTLNNARIAEAIKDMAAEDPDELADFNLFCTTNTGCGKKK
ncbi:hypothetical protein [Streptomyces sp. NPDC005141]